MFGKKKSLNLPEGGAFMAIAGLVNLARKLNISAEEFGDLLDLKPETADYLAEATIYSLKKRNKEDIKS